MSDFSIIHEDDHILAVSKPPGMLSVPGIGPEKADCLISRVQLKWPRARIVHRLDRDTSGVIVLALDADTHRELSRQFHDRETEKRYVSVVAGHIGHDSGVIDLPMRKDMDPAKKPRHVIDHKDGRQAVTEWSVIHRHSVVAGDAKPTRVTRLALRPITGRSHQLRLHLLSIGHPILGDDLYAPPAVISLAARLMLHAEALCVTDPYTAAPMRFVSPCPF